MKYEITPHYIPKGTKRRRGNPMTPGVKFIVAHDTGAPNFTARRVVNYYIQTADTVENAKIASAHIFVDDKEIIECIPVLTGPPEKASHVLRNVRTDNTYFGFNANDAAIGIEYCYGVDINADEAYRKYVWAFAYACLKYNLDPKTKITSHSFLDPGRKFDPQNGLSFSRRTYTQLLIDIAEEFNILRGNNPNKTYQEIVETGTVTTSAKLNIRKGQPSTKAPIYQVVERGTKLNYVSYVTDGQSINGNAKWYRDDLGNYYWSGGVFRN